MNVDEQMRQLLARLRYLEDRQAILDVVVRHARGHDRHDVALMNSCFWADGVDEHGQFVTPGPEYGDWANAAHSGGYMLHNHNIANHSCEIDGDTAHAETYVMGAFLPRHAPGSAKVTCGRYIDRLERRNDEWKIAVRRTVIDVEIEGQTTWPQGPVPGTFPKGTWEPTDLSYARPVEIDTPASRWDGSTR
jgi:hypothetical protein